jgi:general secretion pathway protein H
MGNKAVKVKTRTYLYNRGKTSGFTLLEILLVLGIIALGASLLAPNFGVLESRGFSVQVRDAASQLNFGRRSAVINGRTSIVFLAGETQFDFSSVKEDIIARWVSNDIGLKFFDSTDREIISETNGFEVSFYPEGGSSGGTLIFFQNEQTVKIFIDPFSGRIKRE